MLSTFLYIKFYSCKQVVLLNPNISTLSEIGMVLYPVFFTRLGYLLNNQCS